MDVQQVEWVHYAMELPLILADRFDYLMMSMMVGMLLMVLVMLQ
jgi:hypothetical protein